MTHLSLIKHIISSIDTAKLGRKMTGRKLFNTYPTFPDMGATLHSRLPHSRKVAFTGP